MLLTQRESERKTETYKLNIHSNRFHFIFRRGGGGGGGTCY